MKSMVKNSKFKIIQKMQKFSKKMGKINKNKQIINQSLKLINLVLKMVKKRRKKKFSNRKTLILVKINQNLKKFNFRQQILGLRGVGQFLISLK